ncbi:Alpha-ketoglutarate-dependent dioxygenase alkB 2 [Mactra antiquata]
MDKFVIRKRSHDDEGIDHKPKRKCSETLKDENGDKEDCAISNFVVKSPAWRHLKGQNLNCDYCVFFSKSCADEIFKECEKLLTYNEGQLAKVNLFGKWHDIPRKQVAHGDEGLSYTFSNNTVPARPWTPFLKKIKDTISEVTGHEFNFVLINRYKDGKDHMGEHRDDEKDLVQGHPIASLSLGQPRDFIFKHADSRGKNAKCNIDPVKIELQHGSLLLMNHPTNTFWYHSLPQRKKLLNSWRCHP